MPAHQVKPSAANDARKDCATDYPDTQLFIAGVWRPASSRRSIDVIDPATDDVLGTVAQADQADLAAAVDAARTGFLVWSEMSAFERGKIMRNAADLLRQRAGHLSPVLTQEQGKPLGEAMGEIMAGADIIDWFAEEGRRSYGQIIPARSPSVTQLTLKLPVGPVAAFAPWNFPINQVVRKLSAALSAGCSIIIKAPDETPASPAALVRCFEEAGVPAGAINLVYGDAREVSSYLIADPAICKISFTGSTMVGKQLASLAGEHMKRATMELGGHAPVIILDDADVEKAVSILAAAKYRNAGQVCVSPTRFLVQDGVFDAFAQKFTAFAKSIRVGNGLSPESQMGPLANMRRLSAVAAITEDAVAHGAELTTGGQRIGNRGNFFEPTVLLNAPLDSAIMNDEPFGPVAVINRFSSLDEAISEANRLPYGLASYAFTRSAHAAQVIGRRVNAGMTSINHIGLGLPEVPFGGVRDSGYGTEGGSEAIEPYLVTKFISHLAEA
ncbi:NAD-dependent succinate-semialdehyde dehydrogenase [Brucella intermedia]|uniref:NAD-dependent succinate-semialdehyde dehydrogenase n=1 Tax=Brucella intermedia TaxID=94625 RepID=UPI00224AEAEB|nr:NAD-dependent succinate-semialdehyde dehydrogenase [Brucella intermedia]